MQDRARHIRQIMPVRCRIDGNHASEDAGVIAVYPASYRHDLTDVPRSSLQCLLASGHSLYALNDILTAESENSDAE